MSEYGFGSSFGLITEDTCAAGPDGVYGATEYEVGSITCAGDTWKMTTKLVSYNYRLIYFYKNDVLYTTMEPRSNYGGYAGGIMREDENHPDYVDVYYFWSTHEQSLNATIEYMNSLATIQQQQGGGATYGAYHLGTYPKSSFITEREWDESPSTDPTNDPLNELPQGGEYADIGDFSETFLQLLSQLLEPESLNYGHFITAYQLDSDNLVDIGDFLFDAGFWQNLKNKFDGLSDPMSMIIGAVELPFTLAEAFTTFKLGGIEVQDGEGNPISCGKHTSRYVKHVFGSITLKEVWGSEKDYTECDVSIFLPYVGMRQLDPDLVVNSTLTLGVIIDTWTGDLNYLLEVNNSDMSGKYFNSSGVPYRFSGNCGNRIPIGKVDPSTPILNVASSLGSMAIGAGLIAATGGIGAGAAAAGALSGVGAGAGGALAGGVGGAMIASAGRNLASDITSGFNPSVQSSGNISGALGFLDYQYAYLVIKRGIPQYPNNWRAQIGAPRYQTFSGTSMTGFTQFAEIHLEQMGDASEDERRELERLLKEEGVIL